MKKTYALLPAALLLLASYYTPAALIARRAPAQAPADTAFSITIAARPPHDLAAGASPKQLAEFAWAEFFALNWQSAYTPQNPKRDIPDLSWSFSNPDAPLVVWETYAHRTELRPYSGARKPFDSQPTYTYGRKIGPAPNPSGIVTSFHLFDNLDENSEIGSCNMYGQVNSGKPMVLYQAKVNREEYDYIAGSNRLNTQDSLTAATTRTARHIKADSAYYQPKPGQRYSTCDCPPGVVCLPCGSARPGGRTGTIEIKSAWRQLTPQEDASRFVTRTVLYYKPVITSKLLPNGTTVRDTAAGYANGRFALIGLHIIHKTENYPDFVFATWEHVGVEKQHMGYQLLNGKGYPTGPLQAPFARLHPISTVANQATAAAHRKLRALNPKSAWLNYRLVGVQGTPTNDSTALNFFLANYVVESDKTLADFHGSGIGTPHDHKPNTLYQGRRLSVGGCQGCHGVAQRGGSDFSFLLDNVGKPVFAPDIDASQRPKLLRLIRATAQR
jgi:hypothetical protein